MANAWLASGTSNRKRWVIGCVVVAALGAAAGWWWTHRVSAGGAAAAAPGADVRAGRRAGGREGAGPGGGVRNVPVQVGQVTRGDAKVYLSALGTVTAPSSVLVRPRVDGQLMRMPVHEGDVVKAGQLIAEIDPRSFQVQVAQAEGQLAKDQAQLASARQQLARFQTLLSQDSIARQQVDTQDALVKQYEGAIKADQAAVDSARLQLTYARVTAPVAGRLGLRQVDPGNIVHGSDATGLFVINQVQPINVVFTLPEAQLPAVMASLRAGDKLRVDVWDRQKTTQLAKGSVESFDNQIDSTTGTVKFRARFANEDLALFPNQFVNVDVLAQTIRDVTLAPEAAIQRGREGAFVYLVKADNTVTMTKVKTGVVNGNQIVIEAGLQPGDRVVVDGIDQLRDGARIEVSDASALLKPSGHKRGHRPAGAEPGASAPASDASAPRAWRRRQSEQ